MITLTLVQGILALLVCILGFYITDWVLKRFGIGVPTNLVGLVWFIIFVLILIGRIALPI